MATHNLCQSSFHELARNSDIKPVTAGKMVNLVHVKLQGDLYRRKMFVGSERRKAPCLQSMSM